MTADGAFAVLEVGGTHSSSALVSGAGEAIAVRGPIRRRDIDATAAAEDLLDAVAGPLALTLGRCRPGTGLVVALPGPFDYERGVGDYRGVGKFGAWSDVDVRGGLAHRIGRAARELVFVNDAVAFGVGEHAAGAGRGSERVVGLTLGTGVGSVFMAGETVVTSGPGIPPGGRMDLVLLDGRPLEQLISRAAIREGYQRLTAGRCPPSAAAPDVSDIFTLVRGGDEAATTAVTVALAALTRALAPPLRGFRADAVVVGGSVARSWDVLGPLLRSGLAREGVGGTAVLPAALGEQGPFIGAAVHCMRSARTPG